MNPDEFAKLTPEQVAAFADWRPCPECGKVWPHISGTSGMMCPSCRLSARVSEILNDRRFVALSDLFADSDVFVSRCGGTMTLSVGESEISFPIEEVNL